MKWLILYYDRIQQKYLYRIFDNSENCLSFREKILNSGLCRTCYVYKLYGRKSGKYEE